MLLWGFPLIQESYEVLISWGSLNRPNLLPFFVHIYLKINLSCFYVVILKAQLSFKWVIVNQEASRPSESFQPPLPASDNRSITVEFLQVMWGRLECDTCTASPSVFTWDLTPECSWVDKEDKGSISAESLLWTRPAAPVPSLRRGGVLLFNQSSLPELSSSGAKVRPLLVLIKMNRRGLIGVIEAYLRLQLCRHEM